MGDSAREEHITLLQCQRAGWHWGNIQTESYSIGTAFASDKAWFTPGEHVAFKSLDLKYTNFDEWVGVCGLRGSGFEELMNKRKKKQIVYKPPKRLPSVKIKDYTVSIRFLPECTVVTPRTRQATLKQITSFHIKPRKSRTISLDNTHTLVKGIQNLLSLLTYDDPIYPLVVEGMVDIKDEKGETKPDATMRMFYNRLGTTSFNEDLLRENMLLTYKDINYDLENALNKIIVVKGDTLKPVFDQFFAEYFSPSPYVEDRFMAVIRAIEAFHRRTCERDYYVEKKEYNDKYFEKFYLPVREAVKDAGLSADLRQSFRDGLKNRLSYGYQYSLRKRLDELFTSPYGEAFLTLFIIKQHEQERLGTLIGAGTEEKTEQKRKKWAKEQRTDFIQKVVRTRNWFTHFDEDDKPHAITGGKELAYLTLKLKLFMIALLLGYIGMPVETINEKLRHDKFNYLKSES